MANYVGNRDGGKTSENGLTHFVSNLVSGNTIGTGWQVTQRGAGANMSVDVAIGAGKIDSGSSYAYTAWSDAINNVAITTADATNPRRDIIVAYVDKAVVSSASNDNPGALKFIAVAGTPAGSPSDPSGSTIQSAVGAGNPYAQLARVSVAASASSITNAVIADLRTTVTVNANIGGSDGWNSLGYTPSAVTANGNRSYSLTFSGIDLTSTLSAGMRLRTTRTVAAPTQSTSLNGSTQYYSKSSPAGMTFTDDFTVSAWIKPSLYGGIIASRYNGTSGWYMYMNTSGQIQLIGFNAGAANFSYILSYQSVPTNKWSHVAAQLDMSSFTNTPTTSYIMIDGVDVPSTVTRGGTNPTALIQAGNLEIGSDNGGLNTFLGKIAQVAIYNAKVTQANVRTSMTQGLAGSETSLVSAYSFNNTINDLNANANNLTANGSAVATNADSPFAQAATAGTLEYGIIAATPTFSTNTTVVVQVPEGSAIPTSGGVSATSYSTQAVPFGFPRQKGKWRIATLNRTNNTTTSNATYGSFLSGGHQLVVPIGEWEVGHFAGYNNAITTSVYFAISATSLAGLAAVNASLATDLIIRTLASSAAAYLSHSIVSQHQSLAAATTYTMQTLGATTSAGFDATVEAAQIFAEFDLL